MQHRGMYISATSLSFWSRIFHLDPQQTQQTGEILKASGLDGVETIKWRQQMHQVRQLAVNYPSGRLSLS